jgi:hypothetical protein
VVGEPQPDLVVGVGHVLGVCVVQRGRYVGEPGEQRFDLVFCDAGLCGGLA